jgi:RNA polymerase sigma factor (sigma-70 family)
MVSGDPIEAHNESSAQEICGFPAPSEAGAAAVTGVLDGRRKVGASEICRRFHDELLDHAEWLLGDSERAKDLVQELYVRLPRLLDRGDEQVILLLPYLRACLKKLAANERARESRRQELRSSLPSLPFEPDPSGSLVSRCACESVLRRLPPADARILRMKYLDGMSGREIAAQLGITEGAAWTRVHRVTAAARSLLGAPSSM